MFTLYQQIQRLENKERLSEAELCKLNALKREYYASQAAADE